MKNQSKNSKNFWQDETISQTKIERQKIEYLVEKRKHENAKFSTKFKKFIKKLF